MTNVPATVAAWHRVAATGNAALLDAILADDVVFHSPAIHAPQVGKELTTTYLTAALVVLGPSLTYTREWYGDGSAVLEFTAELDGLTVNGVDMFAWGADGRITDFQVMARPFTGLTKLMERMAAQLAVG